MNTKKIILVITLIGIIVGGTFAYNMYKAIFTPNTKFSTDKEFIYIPTGANFSDVKIILSPLLANIETFEKVAERKGYINNIKAGKYAIKKGANNNELVNVLRLRGLPVKVAFNNQETLANLAGRISTQIEADSIALLNAFNDSDFLKANGFNDNNSLAMYLPNSYEFFWNTSAIDFRERMLKEYQRFWTEDRLKKAEKIKFTKEEVIALASIVHKETAKVDERPRVAGVYLNRIRKGIKLQADPTVIFSLKKQANNFNLVIKRVLYKDLEIDSPFNTYKYAGLPPGPIAMPDISAIDAVLNAEKHDYIFFVANVKNFGYHTFAKTLAQHNRNKEQYVRWLNKQKISR